MLTRIVLRSLTARRYQRSTTREVSCADQSSPYQTSTRACSFVLPLDRRLYMYLCTTPDTTWTHAYRCFGLCVRVHVFCMCTPPQDYFSCTSIVYSVFRHPLPCNPSTAPMFISHHRLRNTTLLSACTGHQIRASQFTHSPP